MKKAVMYGAGNIGRGFIGQLFSESGYEVVFLDIAEAVINSLNDQGGYPVVLTSREGSSQVWVSHVRGVNSRDAQAAANEIATADVVATAVGANILPRIAPVMAMGIAQRLQAGGAPLNIIICENLLEADRVLREGILKALDPALHAQFADRIGLVEASVGRMVPVPTEETRRINDLCVLTEPFARLPVDASAIKGEVPPIKGLEPFAPFDYHIRRKLFMHNMSHATASYLGSLSGCEYLWQAVENKKVRAITRGALQEIAQALSAEYDVPLPMLESFAEELLVRYENRLLGDTVARVGRDTIRKLGPNDRMAGAARLCLQHGVTPGNICTGIAAALRFAPADDAASVEVNAVACTQGIPAALEKYCGFEPGSDLTALVVNADKEL